MLPWILSMVPQLLDLRNHSGKLTLPAACWCWTVRGKRSNQFEQIFQSISIFNPFQILTSSDIEFQHSCSYWFKTLPNGACKGDALLTRAQKKKGFFCQVFWPFEYHVIPSQIFMGNVCTSVCIYRHSRSALMLVPSKWKQS